jgi:hypothetical protein
LKVSALIAGEWCIRNNRGLDPGATGCRQQGESPADVGAKYSDSSGKGPVYVVRSNELVNFVEIGEGPLVAESVVGIERVFSGAIEVDGDRNKTMACQPPTEVLLETGQPIEGGENEDDRELAGVVGTGQISRPMGGADRQRPAPV